MGSFDCAELEGCMAGMLSVGIGVANVGRGVSGMISSAGKFVGNSTGATVGIIVRRGASHAFTKSA